jgi:hypothetical protein
MCIILIILMIYVLFAAHVLNMSAILILNNLKSDCKFVTPSNYLNKDLTENELMFECFTKNVTTCFATKYRKSIVCI